MKEGWDGMAGGRGTGPRRNHGVHFTGLSTIISRSRASDGLPPVMSQKNYEERTKWVYDDRAFSVWNGSFDKPDRVEMIDDDLWAGRSIALLLGVLVAIGLGLALLTIGFLTTWR